MQKRQDLTKALAQNWNVAPETLTLRSIVERAECAGLSTSGLGRLRTDLRRICAGIHKKGRSIASLARFHQRPRQDEGRQGHQREGADRGEGDLNELDRVLFQDQERDQCGNPKGDRDRRAEQQQTQESSEENIYERGFHDDASPV